MISFQLTLSGYPPKSEKAKLQQSYLFAFPNPAVLWLYFFLLPFFEMPVCLPEYNAQFHFSNAAFILPIFA